MRLTDQIIKQLPAPPRGNKIHYDAGVRGFGVRVTAAGAKAFILNYRVAGRERRITIGSYPDWSVSAAREQAKALKRQVDSGVDPLAAVEQSRDAPTINDLCDAFLRDHAPLKRPATQRDYQQQVAVDIRPALGPLKVAAVGYAEVAAWHAAISTRAPVHANRALASLSKMFSLAIRYGWTAANPCKSVERNAEIPRERYLTPPELARLATALAALVDVGAANAIRLLLLTGSRRGELLASRWVDFDLQQGVWSKPASTTKQAKTHRVPLSDVAVALLIEMQRQSNGSEWLFPAPRRADHRINLNDAWNTLRVAAKLPDLHLHDLRHSFASIAVSGGASLPMIGSLLGHASPAMTLRYVHFSNDPLRKIANATAAAITGAKP